MNETTCKKCGESFERTPNHRGYANVCEDCGGFNVPVYIAPKVQAKAVEPKRRRRPMSPEAASRAIDRALLSMADLLATVDPQFRSYVQSVTRKGFNRHVAALRSAAKEKENL